MLGKALAKAFQPVTEDKGVKSPAKVEEALIPAGHQMLGHQPPAPDVIGDHCMIVRLVLMLTDVNHGNRELAQPFAVRGEMEIPPTIRASTFRFSRIRRHPIASSVDRRQQHVTACALGAADHAIDHLCEKLVGSQGTQGREIKTATSRSACFTPREGRPALPVISIRACRTRRFVSSLISGLSRNARDTVEGKNTKFFVQLGATRISFLQRHSSPL